jgi:hypothetical protein
VDRVFSGDSVSGGWSGPVAGAMSVGRSGSLPLGKTAPARTRATCSGSVDLALAGLGGVDELVGHRQPGSATTNARTRRALCNED